MSKVANLSGRAPSQVQRVEALEKAWRVAQGQMATHEEMVVANAKAIAVLMDGMPMVVKLGMALHTTEAAIEALLTRLQRVETELAQLQTGVAARQ